MKKLLCLATALLFIAPLAWGQEHGSISGTVLAEANGGTVPLPFAHVMAYPVNGDRPAGGAMTDSAGHYALNVPFGNYQVKAEAMRFVAEWFDNVAHRSEATVVPVTPESSPTGIDFILSPEQPPPPPDQGSISGTVLGQLDSVTVPLRYAHVLAYPVNGDRPAGMAWADSAGHYAMRVTYGDYQVRAEAMRFLPLWYNNVPERSQATTVSVSEGNNPTGIDFLLSREGPPPPPPGTGSIAGMITNASDNSPIGGASVEAIGTNRMNHRFTRSLEDGSYIFENLIPDTYRVHAFKEGFNPGAFPDSIVIDSNHVTGINIALSPYVLTGISGIVTDAGTTQPIDEAMVTAISVADPGLHYMTWTGEDGHYMLRTRPGEYVVQAMARMYQPLEYPTHVIVPEGGVVESIDFALTPIDFGSIAGMVTDSTGAPVLGAIVEARSLNGRCGQHARTDSTGAYIINYLYPGTYRVRAYARGYLPGMYPDSVVVADGQDVTGIDIVLGSFLPPYNGSIAGVVTDDSTGAVIENAFVMAMAVTPQPGPHFRMFRHTFTDSTGAYAFHDLPMVPFKLFSAARGYIGEFYDNVRDFHDATPVTPNATGINFALTPGPAGGRFLAGMISLAGGIQPGGAVVYAMQNGQIVDIVGADFDGSYAFDNLEPGTYDLSVFSVVGQGQLDQPVDATFNDVSDADIVISPTSVDDNMHILPTNTALSQNYPNPFNAQTMISFNLSTTGRVDLAVYNVVGQKIATLADGEYAAGSYNVIWDGRDSRGNAVSSGIYYYRLKAGDKSETMKMTLLK